jgi:hypothetical protein
MKPKIKILIAREGLIIISLLLLASVSFFVESYVNEQKRTYESNVMEIEPRPSLDEIFAAEKPMPPAKSVAAYDYEGAKAAGISDIILRFPKNTKNEIIKQTIKRDFPNVQRDFPNVQGNGGWIVEDTPHDIIWHPFPKGKILAASYDENGNRVFESSIYKLNFSYAGIFFLLFAYPLYLLSRFIVWSILTLRGTNYT